MEPIKLFIADWDSAHIQRVEATIARRSDMTVVGRATNGRDALKRLCEIPVDLLVTDVQLPGLDGLMLLKDLSDMKRCPRSLICTQFYSDRSLDLARQLGAIYVIYKPLDYGRFPNLVQALVKSRIAPAEPAPEVSALDRDRAVHNKLQALGLPSRLTGTKYLMDAMRLLGGSESGLTRNLSKGLYVRIAEQNQSTPARVERSLRTAISVGYDRGSLSQHFKKRPTNHEFILFLIEAIDGDDRQ